MIKGGAVPLFTPHSKERSSPKRTEHHSMSSFFNKFIQDFLRGSGGIDEGAQPKTRRTSNNSTSKVYSNSSVQVHNFV